MRKYDHTYDLLSDNVSDYSTRQLLNKRSDDDWELVAVVHNPRISMREFYWKRKIQ